MHGSPLSKYDNRSLWLKYDYRDYGIIGEPYFDIDYNKVLYLTDTGRRWNGERFSVRDKVPGKTIKISGMKLRSTRDIIQAVDKGLLPDKITLNIHPQRWHDKYIPWIQELVLQNLKNVVKRYFYVKSHSIYQ